MVLRTPPVKCYSKNSSPVALPPGSFSSGGGGGGLDYIEHTVSKFDTLVGVAIKYGVEVIYSVNLPFVMFSNYITIINGLT